MLKEYMTSFIYVTYLASLGIQFFGVPGPFVQSMLQFYSFM